MREWMRWMLRAGVVTGSMMLPIAAIADTLPVTFALEGTLTNGETASGSFTLYQPFGAVLFDQLSVTGGVFADNFSGPFITAPVPGGVGAYSYGAAGETFDNQGNPTGNLLSLDFPGTAVGFTGGTLCSVANPCPAVSEIVLQGRPGGALEFATLTATPVPEPSAMMLFSTGLAMLASARVLQPRSRVTGR